MLRTPSSTASKVQIKRMSLRGGQIEVAMAAKPIAERVAAKLEDFRNT